MRKKCLFTVGWVTILLFLIACSDKIEPGTTETKPPGVVRTVVETVVVADQSFSYTAVGSVEARTSSTISSKIMGIIRAIHVREGDRIKKDDLLLTIDDRQVSAGLDRAKAGLEEAKRGLEAARAAREVAKADAALAEATFKRYQRLRDDESVSRQEFDEIRARNKKAINGLVRAEAMVAAAKQRINQAKAAVTSAKIGTKDIEVRAPYDGVVITKMTEIGDLASPGMPLLTLEQKKGYQVKLILPEGYLRTISTGQPLVVTIPALADLSLEGTVQTISPTADQRTRSFHVKVFLPDHPNVRSGMFARVAIPVGQAEMITIPRTAVVERGQLNGFYWVDKNSVAHFRLLRIGRILGERVEVVSGLKPGDRYILHPDQKMVNGVAVEANS